MVMKEHVTQCNSVAHWRVVNSFWTTMELHGTEEEDKSGFETHTQYLLEDTFIAGFHLFMWFVDNKKNIE